MHKSFEKIAIFYSSETVSYIIEIDLLPVVFIILVLFFELIESIAGYRVETISYARFFHLFSWSLFLPIRFLT